MIDERRLVALEALASAVRRWQIAYERVGAFTISDVMDPESRLLDELEFAERRVVSALSDLDLVERGQMSLFAEVSS